ncbi:glycosyltransferase family 4 protein [Xenorhabdus sp. SF857]|uniref:glycosyltransferase family 4 protein n=1 Tax=Xenorhabdus bakwenae TaxID=3026967 RepID=UPI0025582E9F|nr:glycosyltransferase family 4 protein [Xenorhabdus sp. SF857]WFQ78876.1 glycosyltransferase family 4 protein [Xenorhabdus sp. SF857]
MKKIAHIQLLPLLSGVQKVCLDELLRLDPSEFERYLICSSPGPLTEEAEKVGIKCIYISTLTRDISPKQDLITLFNLISIFKKYKFDIVHTHSSKPGVLGRIAAKICGVRFIVHTVHGFSFPAAKNKIQNFIFYVMEKIGTLCGDMLICLHDNDKNIAMYKLGSPYDKTIILKNGVDTNHYIKHSSDKIENLRNEIGFDDNDIIIGMVGRLWPQKNPILLIDACKDLLLKDQRLHLVFIGDGELKNSILNKSKELSIEYKVHLMGWRKDTNNFLNVFDIFVLPSLYEGMPLAILEAQSSSLPCIVSDIPGNNHLVENNVTGLLFESNSIDELKEKLCLLINNSHLRKKWGNVQGKK